MVITTNDIITIFFLVYSIFLSLGCIVAAIFLRMMRKGKEIEEKKRMDLFTDGFHNNFGNKELEEDLTEEQLEEGILNNKEDNKAFERLNKCQEEWKELPEEEKLKLDELMGTERKETYNNWFRGCMMRKGKEESAESEEKEM